MDYCFGAGDGVVTAWDAPPNVDLDGDGVMDAVRLDFDGDGLFDDMMWDADGDGSADHSVLDIDNDGRPETYFTDDGLGTWRFHVERSGSISWFGLDGMEHPGGTADIDGDGKPDQLFDVDGDGDAEELLVQPIPAIPCTPTPPETAAGMSCSPMVTETGSPRRPGPWLRPRCQRRILSKDCPSAAVHASVGSDSSATQTG